MSSIRSARHPDGYVAVEALSDDGKVRSDNWIEFEAPLEGKILFGNYFYLEHAPPAIFTLSGHVYTGLPDGRTSRGPRSRCRCSG